MIFVVILYVRHSLQMISLRKIQLVDLWLMKVSKGATIRNRFFHCLCLSVAFLLVSRYGHYYAKMLFHGHTCTCTFSCILLRQQWKSTIPVKKVMISCISAAIWTHTVIFPHVSAKIGSVHLCCFCLLVDCLRKQFRPRQANVGPDLGPNFFNLKWYSWNNHLKERKRFWNILAGDKNM